jgi:hypothetical protein
MVPVLLVAADLRRTWRKPQAVGREGAVGVVGRRQRYVRHRHGRVELIRSNRLWRLYQVVATVEKENVNVKFSCAIACVFHIWLSLYFEIPS